MDNKIKISACVVLYNPENYIIPNICMDLNQISHLYIIDNSDLINYNSSFEKDNITYIKNNENKGVASALNQAANLAIAQGFDYLLTLDQDSTLDSHLVERYMHYLHSNNNKFLGWLSPHYIYEEYSGQKGRNDDYPISISMTSGSLLNLKAYKQIGPFIDNFFIDYIDIEYCLRLRKEGFEIIKIHEAIIYHNLGIIYGRKFLFMNISVTNHSPLRLYYRTRNRFFVYKTYLKYFPIFVLKDLIVFFNELIKILLYEKNKIEKYKWIIKGFVAFLENKMGKYENLTDTCVFNK
ncbi:MAG: glycosyltransferase [Ignavibacteriaceae bacterium]|nr:glycosyltransferase [Ignavibacteriaceae bacterium]